MTAYNKKRVYAMYQGDKFLCQGTTQEICQLMGITPRAFYKYRSIYYQNISKTPRHRIIVRIDEE